MKICDPIAAICHALSIACSCTYSNVKKCYVGCVYRGQGMAGDRVFVWLRGIPDKVSALVHEIAFYVGLVKPK